MCPSSGVLTECITFQHKSLLHSAQHPAAKCLPSEQLLFSLAVTLQIKNGETFVSETDTEVIPKLLKFAYDSMAAEQDGIGRVPFPKVHQTAFMLGNSSCNQSARLYAADRWCYPGSFHALCIKISHTTG